MKVPAISMSAARTATGDLVLALINLDAHRKMPLDVVVAGAPVHSVRGTILNAVSMDARNTFDAPHTLEPTWFADAHLSSGRLSVGLPPKSAVMLTLH